MTAITPSLERSPQRQHLRLVAPVERHTFATTLAAKGVHPSTARKMLGHSDIRMTPAIYTHATDEMQDAATAALESAFGKSTVAVLLPRGPGKCAGAFTFLRVLWEF
jgi:hypothetical protein